MPRIAKWKEKYECVKISAKPVKFFLEDTKTDYFEGRMTLDEIAESFAAYIDQVVEESLKNSLRFDQFVDVKEVPNG